MAKQKFIFAILYARVSQEIQAEGNSVSIDQQLIEMRTLCQKREWGITNEYIDIQNYLATQMPNKGKVVNPSGERADRPAFLNMLEEIKIGDCDFVLCWRDDRLVRHPRVEVALEDALDWGDTNRKGREKIQIIDATGAVIDRFTLAIKASVWREENKRRAERGKMGKKATLLSGRWSSEYRRYGYKSVKTPGQRGRAIELDPITAPIVKRIYEMYDGGLRIADIRRYLIENNVPQIYTMLVKHKWSSSLIARILRSEEYLGEAVWTFSDDIVIKVKIPPIIEPDLWKRVQDKFERNKRLSPRNTRGIYLLQGILFCGECSYQLSISQLKGYGTYRFGEGNGHSYRCINASHNPHEKHPQPSSHNGVKFDWVVWRFVVDKLLSAPENAIALIGMQVDLLNLHGESADGEIAQIERRLEGIQSERSFYQIKTAQGKIEESEFDQRMDETTSEIEHLNSRLVYLLKLRHDAALVQSSVDYLKVVFLSLAKKAALIDIRPEIFRDMPKEQQNKILQEKRTILRTIIEKALAFPNQQIKIFCKVDGSEALSLGIQGYWSPLLKLSFEFEINIADWIDTKSRKHWWIKGEYK